VTLVLVGQPELRERVAAVPQFDQRLSIRYHLYPLDLEHTYNYILHRLRVAGQEDPVFMPDAVEAIFELTAGIPRRINNLCDLSLLVGFMKGLEKIDGLTVYNAK
jgi:general secretion pathway protein A